MFTATSDYVTRAPPRPVIVTGLAMRETTCSYYVPMKTRLDLAKRKRRYVRFTRWRRRRFFALLAEGGNVRVACELSRVGLGCVYRLRQTEPRFVALMAAAVAEADARLALRQARDRREGEEGPSTALHAVPLPTASPQGGII
jgi:hypothetical protein